MKTNMNRRRKNKQRVEEDEGVGITLSSADLASHDDILMEILLRLPIRSLIRSKCVSKHWRYIISSPRFALLRNPYPSSPRGLFLQRIFSGTTPEYDFVPFDCENPVKPPFKALNFDADVSHSGIVVLQSSSGLMLCHSMHEYMHRESKQIVYNARYYVYNPTINQFTTLPEPDGFDWCQRRPCGMTLAFDPLKSPHYKVICVRGYLWCHCLYHIEVYSSEKGSWEASSRPFPIQVDTEFMGGVYWNDAVHWVNKKGHVLYLKINEGRLDQIPAPTMHDRWNVKRHCYPLVESRHSLLFVDIFPSCSMKFDVYEMNTDYSGWLVKYHVNLDEVITVFPEMSPNVLTYWRHPQSFVIHSLVLGEREEDAFLVLEIPGKAIRYNLVSKTCQKLCDFNSSRPFNLSIADDGFSKVGRWPGAFLFIESLSHV